MNYKPRIVLFNDNAVGIAIGTKMDPNYIVVSLLFPSPHEHLVFHKDSLTFTSLLPSDLDGITTFAEFQQTYPEYFI